MKDLAACYMLKPVIAFPLCLLPISIGFRSRPNAVIETTLSSNVSSAPIRLTIEQRLARVGRLVDDLPNVVGDLEANIGSNLDSAALLERIRELVSSLPDEVPKKNASEVQPDPRAVQPDLRTVLMTIENILGASLKGIREFNEASRVGPGKSRNLAGMLGGLLAIVSAASIAIPPPQGPAIGAVAGFVSSILNLCSPPIAVEGSPIDFVKKSIAEGFNQFAMSEKRQDMYAVKFKLETVFGALQPWFDPTLHQPINFHDGLRLNMLHTTVQTDIQFVDEALARLGQFIMDAPKPIDLDVKHIWKILEEHKSDLGDQIGSVIPEEAFGELENRLRIVCKLEPHYTVVKRLIPVPSTYSYTMQNHHVVSKSIGKVVGSRLFPYPECQHGFPILQQSHQVGRPHWDDMPTLLEWYLEMQTLKLLMLQYTVQVFEANCNEPNACPIAAGYKKRMSTTGESMRLLSESLLSHAQEEDNAINSIRERMKNAANETLPRNDFDLAAPYSYFRWAWTKYFTHHELYATPALQVYLTARDFIANLPSGSHWSLLSPQHVPSLGRRMRR